MLKLIRDVGADHERPRPRGGWGCFFAQSYSPELLSCALLEYDADMATQNPTEAEAFQLFLAEQVSTTGRSKTPEELVHLWREQQKEHTETLEAIEEGIADMEADRVYPFDEVNEEIRRKFGWSSHE
jgi:hypothetical protein